MEVTMDGACPPTPAVELVYGEICIRMDALGPTDQRWVLAALAATYRERWEWRHGWKAGRFHHAVRVGDGPYGRSRCGMLPNRATTAGWQQLSSDRGARCVSCEQSLLADARRQAELDGVIARGPVAA